MDQGAGRGRRIEFEGSGKKDWISTLIYGKILIKRGAGVAQTDKIVTKLNGSVALEETLWAWLESMSESHQEWVGLSTSAKPMIMRGGNVENKHCFMHKNIWGKRTDLQFVLPCLSALRIRHSMELPINLNSYWTFFINFAFRFVRRSIACLKKYHFPNMNMSRFKII